MELSNEQKGKSAVVRERGRESARERERREDDIRVCPSSLSSRLALCVVIVMYFLSVSCVKESVENIAKRIGRKSRQKLTLCASADLKDSTPRTSLHTLFFISLYYHAMACRFLP
jgi:hypothetical protein